MAAECKWPGQGEGKGEAEGKQGHSWLSLGANQLHGVASYRTGAAELERGEWQLWASERSLGLQRGKLNKDDFRGKRAGPWQGRC